MSGFRKYGRLHLPQFDDDDDDEVEIDSDKGERCNQVSAIHSLVRHCHHHRTVVNAIFHISGIPTFPKQISGNITFYPSLVWAVCVCVFSVCVCDCVTMLCVTMCV